MDTEATVRGIMILHRVNLRLQDAAARNLAGQLAVELADSLAAEYGPAPKYCIYLSCLWASLSADPRKLYGDPE